MRIRNVRSGRVITVADGVAAILMRTPGRWEVVPIVIHPEPVIEKPVEHAGKTMLENRIDERCEKPRAKTRAELLAEKMRAERERRKRFKQIHIPTKG